MNRILRHVRASVETMSPGYFSMVMATGILSLAAHLLAVPWLPGALFVLNWILFAIIGVLALARLYWYPRRVVEDLLDHLSAPGFFTFVAACGCLDSRCLLLGGTLRVTVLLGGVGPLGVVRVSVVGGTSGAARVED